MTEEQSVGKKSKELSFLNPNKQKTIEQIKTAKTEINKINKYKHIEHYTWFDALRSFEVLLNDKREYARIVLSGNWYKIPQYYSTLYNIFNFLIVFFGDEIRYQYSQLFKQLFVRIHTVKTTTEFLNLVIELVEIDEKLMIARESFGLGLSNITIKKTDEDSVQEYFKDDDDADN